ATIFLEPLKLCSDQDVSTPSSNVDGALLWTSRTALHAKVVYRLRRNGPMRTRCAEKLILSINKDASALFLPTNNRRIDEASTDIDKPGSRYENCRCRPVDLSRPGHRLMTRSERKPRRPECLY